MKKKSNFLLLLASFFFLAGVHAQFGGIGNKIIKAGAAKGAKALGVDEILKQPAAISTAFEDVNRNGEMMPDFKSNEVAQPLVTDEKIKTDITNTTTVAVTITFFKRIAFSKSGA